jgi:hypothetical protein
MERYNTHLCHGNWLFLAILERVKLCRHGMKREVGWWFAEKGRVAVIAYGSVLYLYTYFSIFF